MVQTIDPESDPNTRSGTRRRSPFRFLGLGILAVAILPIWFLFFAPKIRHDRLVEKGVQVEGRLLSVEETGTYINDSPELELTVAYTRKDGVLDTSATDFVPSRRSIHLFQEGVPVMIAYDPEEPEEFTVISLGTPEPATGTAPAAQELTGTLDSLRRMADSLRATMDSIKKNVQGTGR